MTLKLTNHIDKFEVPILERSVYKSAIYNLLEGGSRDRVLSTY